MSKDTVQEPLVFIVSGPSGSGKSTLVQNVLQMPGTMASRSCTTRARRATEASGKCYDFVTEEEFEAMVSRGEFLEYARVFGKHSYGTPKKWLPSQARLGPGSRN
jgi:guanylate kinase